MFNRSLTTSFGAKRPNFNSEERREGRISIFEKLRAQATSSKFQTPSSKEAPGPKLQTPEKLQARSAGRGLELGISLVLEFGFWCFDSGISLELGV
jgi:hypothetical protein